MKLLLDVGNTAAKWALADATRIDSNGFFVHRDRDFSAQARQAWSEIPTPDAVLVANVAGAGMAAEIKRFVAGAWQLVPEFVRVTEAACGVTNAYSTPDDLGVDRWLAMIAAHHAYDGAVCVIDCGTAVTLDLLAGNGQHRGGLILPGIGMLSQALQVNTAGIQLQDDTPTVMLLAQGTRDGVIGGAQYLVAAAIDRIVADMGDAAGGPVAAIITGGHAEQLLPLMKVTVQHAPELVLQGLAILSDGGA